MSSIGKKIDEFLSHKAPDSEKESEAAEVAAKKPKPSKNKGEESDIQSHRKFDKFKKGD